MRVTTTTSLVQQLQLQMRTVLVDGSSLPFPTLAGNNCRYK